MLRLFFYGCFLLFALCSLLFFFSFFFLLVVGDRAREKLFPRFRHEVFLAPDCIGRGGGGGEPCAAGRFGAQDCVGHRRGHRHRHHQVALPVRALISSHVARACVALCSKNWICVRWPSPRACSGRPIDRLTWLLELGHVVKPPSCDPCACDCPHDNLNYCSCKHAIHWAVITPTPPPRPPSTPTHSQRPAHQPHHRPPAASPHPPPPLSLSLTLTLLISISMYVTVASHAVYGRIRSPLPN